MAKIVALGVCRCATARASGRARLPLILSGETNTPALMGMRRGFKASGISRLSSITSRPSPIVAWC